MFITLLLKKDIRQRPVPIIHNEIMLQSVSAVAAFGGRDVYLILN